MVDMSHHRHDRGARHEVFLVVRLLTDSFLHLCADIFRLEAELICHEVDGLSVQALIDRHHDPHAHQGTDDLGDTDIHHGSKLTDGNELRQLQCLALLSLLASLLVQLLLDSLALLLTILGAFLVLVALIGQSCQRLLYLTCHVLLVHLKRFLVALAVLVLLPLVLATLVILLVGSGVDIHALITDALALLALAVIAIPVLLGFLLTLLALLLLRFLLRTSALVQGVQVDLPQHIHLRGVEDLLLALQLEDLWLALLRFLCRLRLWGRLLNRLRFRLGLLCRFLCRSRSRLRFCGRLSHRLWLLHRFLGRSRLRSLRLRLLLLRLRSCRSRMFNRLGRRLWLCGRLCLDRLLHLFRLCLYLRFSNGFRC